MAGLHLTLLGNPQVTLNGLPLTDFSTAKTEALLYYLAVTGRTHSRDTLAELLWGEMPEDKAKRNLSKALSTLRSLVEPYLVSEGQTLAFNQAAPHQVDVAVFEAIVEVGAGAQDLTPLHRAVALYQGDFLEGFYVKNAFPFEEWVLHQRERLRELVLQALDRLISEALNGADYATGLKYAARLLLLDSWRESAHRQMMLLLARNGQREAALAQYESCRRILAEELGVEPTAETTALYERLKGVEAPPHNLPMLSLAFVGREMELKQLIARLNDPTCRLVTLVGPGGIGKTRLALQAAAHYIQPQITLDETTFSGGVYFVNLTPIGATATSSKASDHANHLTHILVSAIAEALNFSFQGPVDLLTQLTNHLQNKTILLVLDDFEGLMVVANLIADILQRAPRLKLLVTSRERLNLWQEWVMEVGGLEYPLPLSALARGRDASASPLLAEVLAGERQYSAITLFVQQAQRVRAGFTLGEAEIPHVTRICQLVEGSPLALELAASWLRALSCAEIVAEIERSLDFLTSSLRNAPERHRSVRAVFEQSWRLLSEPEQAVFARLSLFRGGFWREAAQEVAGASLLTLAGLVDKSLLRLAPSGRYEIHELLRQYGAGKLAEDSLQETEGRDRHSAYYCALLKRHEANLKGSRQQMALAEIEVDIENVRAAWSWAITQGYIESLEQALESLALFFDWHGRYQEGELTCRLAAEKLAPAETSYQLRLLIKLLTWQSNFNWALGQSELAEQQLRQNLVLLDNPLLASEDTRLEKASVLLHLGRVALSSNREEAHSLFEQSLSLYRATGDLWWMAQALGWLGEVDWEAGRYDQAKQLAEESLALRQRWGDQEGIANAYSLLGWIALTQGQLEEAERLHQESLALYRKMGLQAPIAGALRNLGAAYIFLGQFTQALAVLEESLAIFSDLGNRSNLVFANILSGAALLQLGRYEQARTQLQSGLNLAQACGDWPGMGYALLWLGRTALIRQAYSEAWQLQHDGVSLFRKIGQQDQLSTALSSLGLGIYKLGNSVEARRYLAEALQMAVEIGAFLPLLFAFPLASLLLADQNEKERAVELYALAARYPFVANSHWMKAVFGQPLSAAAATLPPERVAAAQKRGQARDVWLTAAELLAELSRSEAL